MTNHPTPTPLSILLAAVALIGGATAVAAGAAVIVGALLVAAAAFDAGRHLAPVHTSLHDPLA